MRGIRMILFFLSTFLVGLWAAQTHSTVLGPSPQDKRSYSKEAENACWSLSSLSLGCLMVQKEFLFKEKRYSLVQSSLKRR